MVQHTDAHWFSPQRGAIPDVHLTDGRGLSEAITPEALLKRIQDLEERENNHAAEANTFCECSSPRLCAARARATRQTASSASLVTARAA